MKQIGFLSMVLALAVFTSCNQGTKKEQAKTTDAHEMTEADGSDYTACQHSSKIYWKGTKPTGEHTGIVKLAEGGSFVVEDDKLVGGEFIIDMASIANIDLEDADMNAKLVGHLKSADFFDVETYPTAKFVITEVLPADAEAFSHEIKGNLTIKDITKGIAFMANVKINEGMVSAKSEEFVIDRTLWGVNYKSKSVFKELKDKFISDEISLTIDGHSM